MITIGTCKADCDRMNVPLRRPTATAVSSTIAAVLLASFLAPVAVAQPVQVRLRHSEPSRVTLSWEADPANAYRIEHSPALTQWGILGSPLAAPPGGGILGGWIEITLPREFFRVETLPLIDSPIPTEAGIHAGLGLVHDGIPRQYILGIPPSYSAETAAPLALILHGHGQTATSFATRHPDLFREAQERGMLLALPDGLETAAGTGWSSQDAEDGWFQRDDVGFLVALVERLKSTLNVDSHRVYAGGFSAGGAMCHYLGARTTNVFAALAAVGSGFGRGPVDDPYEPYPPAGPMPVLMVNATNDCGWPYWGGMDGDLLVTAASEPVTYWVAANGCAPVPSVTTNVVVGTVNRINACGPKPPQNQIQTNLVITRHWSHCLPGLETVFVTLTDGGHQWPDADERVGLDANRTVLEFFERHARP